MCRAYHLWHDRREPFIAVGFEVLNVAVPLIIRPITAYEGSEQRE